MSRINITEQIVKEILENDPLARDDDFYLIASVYYKIAPETIKLPFGTVMLGHKELKLPVQASITRARRKLQAKYDNLKPSKKIQELRGNEEMEYIDYAIDGYKNTFSKFVDSQD